MKVSTTFPKRYVSGKHLAGPVLVEVINVKVERMRAGPGRPEGDAYVMRFRQIAGQAITGAECKGGVFALVLRGGLATAWLASWAMTPTHGAAGALCFIQIL